jgi:O-antigen/teichoic acid export membrane protein
MAVEVTQKIVAILFTFISRQIFLQVLTVEHLGVNVLFVDILAFLSLADLGLSSALAYNFYKPLAENNEIKLAALSRFYSRVYKIIAAVVAVIGLALIPFLRQIVRLETDLEHLEIYYLIALLNVVLSFLFVVKAGIISADQHRRIVTMYRMIGSIASMTLQIIILLTIGSFMLFLLMPLVTTLATNLLMARRASKMYPYVKHKATLEAEDRKSVFKSIKSVSIYRLATFGVQNTDNIFISMLVGAAVVGKYANYALAVGNLKMFAYMAFSSLSASIGNLVATESPKKRLQIFKPMQMSSFWLSGFFCFCLFFLLDDFIFLWLGEGLVFGFHVKLVILLTCYVSIT